MFSSYQIERLKSIDWDYYLTIPVCFPAPVRMYLFTFFTPPRRFARTFFGSPLVFLWHRGCWLPSPFSPGCEDTASVVFSIPPRRSGRFLHLDFVVANPRRSIARMHGRQTPCGVFRIGEKEFPSRACFPANRDQFANEFKIPI